MKKSGILTALAGILMFFVLLCGCVNLGMTEKYSVDSNAQISHAEYDLAMDCSTYNLLALSARQEGYNTVKDAIEANLSRNMGNGNIAYAEVWDPQTNRVTISLSRSDTYSPPPDSRISIQEDDDDTVTFQDTTFYSPGLLQAFTSAGAGMNPVPPPPPAPTSETIWNASTGSYQVVTITPTPVPTKWIWDSSRRQYTEIDITPAPVPQFNASEEQEMVRTMLSGITVDYYLEMPGKIVNTTATTVNGNKAEWHFSGEDIFNTTIYAESQPPSLVPGFTSLPAAAGCALGALFLAYWRKRSR